MRYDQLPVFKAAYDLMLEVYRSGQHMKREYRYTLGEKLKEEVVELTACIFRANQTNNKQAHILEARELIEVVRLQIRLLRDLGQMPVRNMAAVTLHIESISKQLAAWHKAVNEKNKKTKQNEEETINEIAG